MVVVAGQVPEQFLNPHETALNALIEVATHRRPCTIDIRKHLLSVIRPKISRLPKQACEERTREH